MTIIRAAEVADALSIVHILSSVWAEEKADVAHVTDALQIGGRTTYVAELEGGIVGLIDAFGTQVWELDLMAVEPSAQGQGIGTRLALASIEAGMAAGFSSVRSLVAIDNIASQRVMHHVGLSRSEPHELWVCSRKLEVQSDADPASVAITAVRTLRYRGGWVNAPFTISSLRDAVLLKIRNSWDVVGAVIPQDNSDALEAARQAGYENIGTYHWWQS